MVHYAEILSNRDCNGRFNGGIAVKPSVRFWGYVEKTEYCWLWKGGGVRYGRFYDGDKDVLAHRYSYELHNGAITEGLYVCHKCDNTFCVNPAHLFLGTQKDNIQDAVSKNRMVYHGSCGEKNGNSKLSINNVVEIKRLIRSGMAGTRIAKIFNICHANVYDIKNGKIWKGIGG